MTKTTTQIEVMKPKESNQNDEGVFKHLFLWTHFDHLLSDVSEKEMTAVGIQMMILIKNAIEVKNEELRVKLLKVKETDILFENSIFDIDIFDSFESTYDATEEVIKYIRKNSNIETHNGTFGFEILFNEETKTALILKSATEVRQKSFTKKKRKKKKNKHDKAKRGTTVLSIHHCASAFLNNEEFQHYELAMSIGSQSHEGCVFLRKNGLRRLEAVYYNPNYSIKQDGVQSSAAAKDLLMSFGNTLQKIEAYHSKCGNEDAKCAGLAWKELFNFIYHGASPFGNDKLKLENYNHYTTSSSYTRYHKKNSAISLEEEAMKSIEHSHFDTWKNFDKLLFHMDSDDILDLSIQLNEVISTHFNTKRKQNSDCTYH